MSTQKRWRRRRDDDFDREIESHLELEIERLVHEGMSPEDARVDARRRFGSVSVARERFYEAGRLLWLDHLRHDVRCAFRNVRRYPVTSIVAIASLAGGIGATTVTLTVRDVVFRRPPLLYQEPGQLSKIQVGQPDRPIRPIGSYVPAALYTIWSDPLGSSTGAATPGRGVREVRTDDRTQIVPVRAVTSELFPVLGVSAALGRTFSSQDSTGGGSAPVVLSHRVWQRLFDGRPDVAGKVLWIENRPHTVVGVMPRRFWFSEMDAPIWTLLDIRTLAPDTSLEVVVRRPRGMTPETLDARLQSGLVEYASHLPNDRRQLRLKVSGLEGTPIGNQVALVLPYVLGASVLLTLLIACANVAILMIGQWTAREHELAIRSSIGASRGRIVQSLLTESVLLALCGGAFGICVTYVLRGIVVGSGGTASTFFDLSIDMGILAQSATIAFLTGIVAGIAPALYETRRLHINPMRMMTTSDRVRQRWRHALVVLEITVTVALLVEAGAMFDGYRRIRTAQMGFDTRPLLSARIENAGGLPTTRILETFSQLPGVVAAAASTSIPYTVSGPRERVALDGTGTNTVVAERGDITADFFRALGVPMRTGRSFTDHDTPAERRAIVNESLARRLFEGQNAVGNRLWIAQIPYDVIGVVADYSSNPLRQEGSEPRVFLPMPAETRDVTRSTFVVRAQSDPASLVAGIRTQARASASGTIVTSADTFDQITQIMGQEMILGTAPLVPLIAMGMLLTMAGIYGVLAFAIARRSRELAVRVAVGASHREVIRLVTAHTARLVGTGSALGIAATFGLARLVRASGGAGSIFDPAIHVFLPPILIVIAIGALATWMPSRRALKIDPAILLRS